MLISVSPASLCFLHFRDPRTHMLVDLNKANDNFVRTQADVTLYGVSRLSDSREAI